MEKAYYGESFELSFKMYDARDKTKAVQSATFTVSDKDGMIIQSGALSIQEDGHTGTFRFNATSKGANRIVISYRIGDDHWKQPFYLNVEEA